MQNKSTILKKTRLTTRMTLELLSSFLNIYIYTVLFIRSTWILKLRFEVKPRYKVSLVPQFFNILLERIKEIVLNVIHRVSFREKPMEKGQKIWTLYRGKTLYRGTLYWKKTLYRVTSYWKETLYSIEVSYFRVSLVFEAQTHQGVDVLIISRLRPSFKIETDAIDFEVWVPLWKPLHRAGGWSLRLQSHLIEV